MTAALLLAVSLAVGGYAVWAVAHPRRCGAPGPGRQPCVRRQHRGTDHETTSGVGWSGVWHG